MQEIFACFINFHAFFTVYSRFCNGDRTIIYQKEYCIGKKGSIDAESNAEIQSVLF